MTSADRHADTLPLSETPTFTGNGWTVRLPVRAEEITLAKQVVVRERVVVRRQQVEGHRHVEARLLREELRTSTSGRVDNPEDTHEITTNRDRTL